MNFSTLIFVVATSIVLTHAYPNNLPPPVIPANCGVPDCSIMSNRYHENALFPHPDPNKYYQCAPYDYYTWKPMERYCICGTVYNPKHARCTFFWSEDWEAICEWSSPPVLAACDDGHKDGWMKTED